MCVYTYIKSNCFAIHQKLTQYCKSTIIKKNFKINFKKGQKNIKH